MDRFLTELKRFRRRWQWERLRCVLLVFVGWLVLTMAVLCWLDLFLSLTSTARIVLDGVCILALLIWLGIRLAGILRIKEKDCAVHADRLLQSRRREVLSALEVGRSKAHTSSISGYLAKAGIDSARERLQTLVDIRPKAQLRQVRRQLFLCLAVALLPALFNLRAARDLSSRFLIPHADIPPYSAYEFSISPENPEVIYGADQVVKVSITGKSVNHPVRFATRQGDHVRDSSCFQAGPSEYLQRLERVMQPVEFCFRVGKARSKWHRLNVLFQPHVQSAQARVIPPAYTLRSAGVFSTGAEPLKGIKGTRVELTVQSNRPLKTGHLTITPMDGDAHSRTVEGTISGKNEIFYQWEMQHNAQLSLMIYDILGTAARKPLRIMQSLVPDVAPEVTLSEPAAFSLATPDTKIPVYASIEDDIGIRRCDMFRSLKGYRSRPVRINTEPGTVTAEVNGEIDLSALGVEPGQVIELFLEASDTNPELTGIGASDIARVKIISEAEYAKMVRSRTTLAAFEERFLTVANAYNELLEMLTQTETDLKKGMLPSDVADERITHLRSKIKDTASSFREIADDFAAFDLEKKLSKTAKEMVAKLEYALGYEGWDSPDKDKRLEAISKSKLLVKNQAQKVRSLTADAEEVMAVSRVMAMAAWYSALLDRQRILVSKLEQYAAGERKISEPRVIAEQADAVRRDLVTLMSELERLAHELPAGYRDMRESSLHFVKTLRALKIPVPMEACARAAKNEQPREAWSYAVQALEKMKQALERCKGSPFEQACSGGMGFEVPDYLSRTMDEMLQSLMRQFGRGAGWGKGIGAAGVGIGGAWEGSYLNGYSAFNMPVYGPKRRNHLSSAAMGSDGTGVGTGAGVGRQARYNEVMRQADTQKNEGLGFFMKAVPPRYRDAVKAFYGEDGQP